uniref:Uncharacterized protein n=1 Tax=Sipha flava TaxID=143950 RepID=A0A2S2R7Q9_9HEMI
MEGPPTSPLYTPLMHKNVVFDIDSDQFYRYRYDKNNIRYPKLISIRCNLKFIFSIYISFDNESMSKNDNITTINKAITQKCKFINEQRQMKEDEQISSNEFLKKVCFKNKRQHFNP